MLNLLYLGENKKTISEKFFVNLNTLVITSEYPKCISVTLRKKKIKALEKLNQEWEFFTSPSVFNLSPVCCCKVCLTAVLWICLSFMYVSKGFALSFMGQHIQHHMEKKMRDILQFYTGLNITDLIWPRNTKKSNHSLNNNYAVSSIYGRHLLYMVAFNLLAFSTIRHICICIGLWVRGRIHNLKLKLC